MGTRLGSPALGPGLWSRKRKKCRGGGHFLMRFQTSLSSERSGDMKLATIEYRKGLGVRGGSSKLIGVLEVFLVARVRWRKPQVPDCQELRRWRGWGLDHQLGVHSPHRPDLVQFHDPPRMTHCYPWDPSSLWWWRPLPTSVISVSLSRKGTTSLQSSPDLALRPAFCVLTFCFYRPHPPKRAARLFVSALRGSNAVPSS